MLSILQVQFSRLNPAAFKKPFYTVADALRLSRLLTAIGQQGNATEEG